jgi:hypothetical protein
VQVDEEKNMEGLVGCHLRIDGPEADL